MNRLIKLYQAKANLAYDRYLLNRQRIGHVKELNSPEWNEIVLTGAKLLAEANTWQAAASLLRKEELSRA